MNNYDIRSVDASKLHTESLQLRNQQFQLATIALAGSGITAWSAPAVIALTSVAIPEIALLAGMVSWLVLLVILYLWSLSLRSLISIISQYLDCFELSHWESRFRVFQAECRIVPEGNQSQGDQTASGAAQKSTDTSNLYKSQTVFTAYAFAAYGILPVTGAVVTALSLPEKMPLSPFGTILLLASLVGYLWHLQWRCKRREQGTAIKEVWERVKTKCNTDI